MKNCRDGTRNNFLYYRYWSLEGLKHRRSDSQTVHKDPAISRFFGIKPWRDIPTLPSWIYVVPSVDLPARSGRRIIKWFRRNKSTPKYFKNVTIEIYFSISVTAYLWKFNYTSKVYASGCFQYFYRKIKRLEQRAVFPSSFFTVIPSFFKVSNDVFLSYKSTRNANCSKRRDVYTFPRYFLSIFDCQ